MGGRRAVRGFAIAAALVVGAVAAGPPAAGTGAGGTGAAEYWTAQRRGAAIPLDLVIDHRGLAYLRGADGRLTPHGHDVAAEHAPLRATPAARPSGPAGGGGGGGGGGSSDTVPPSISAMDPGVGDVVGSSHTFSAVVTDAGSGVRSVTFVIARGAQTWSFNTTANGDVWSVSIQGFTDGAWSWHVVAKDNASKGGNTSSSPSVPFTVDTAAGAGGDVVSNAAWTNGGAVQTAAGRIYFEMPANARHTRWTGYVCSGTVATDAATGRSVIITAAHCIYDDVDKAFARSVLFIPDQAGTSGSGTDLDCSNDPLGCWAPTFGVVDSDWATRTFPDNIPWDYGYYVVPDAGSHSGNGTGGALDAVAGSLTVQFTGPTVGALTHALGYSYSDDPNFMHCAEAMGTEGTANWWLPSCGLSGGSSGGPWVQPMDVSNGTGPVISVNSWGYTTSPGMAGPRLAGSSAECLFAAAQALSASGTARGVIPAAC